MHRSRSAILTAVVGVLALFAVACGGSESSSDSTTTTAGSGDSSQVAGAPTDAEIKALTAKLSGGGASFPDAFYQAVNTDFNGIAGSELVTYAKSGSSDGRKQLGQQTLTFAGSDSVAKDDETFAGGEILYFPTVAAPITVSYNLQGFSGKVQLSADTIAGIFEAKITNWNAPEVVADNPGVDLPGTPIVVVHRSDGSGTTNNFTKYLKAAAPNTWTLDSGDTVNWPATTQGAEKNSGVAQLVKQTDGAVGYVDLADAAKAGLAFASVKNSSGNFVAPSAASVQAALASAEVNPDLTYNPLNAPGAEAYPITAPTWILTYATYKDAATVASLQTYLKYELTTGQAEASSTGYVGIPAELQEQAIAQIAKITAG
ncbi:MAG: phosphate ABC transporter substrate-binding protein PstS [Microthrixaceae bacterium]